MTSFAEIRKMYGVNIIDQMKMCQMAIRPMSPQKYGLISVFLDAQRCSFRWIRLHLKAVFHRFTGDKSREANAEMQSKMPKIRFCRLGTHFNLSSTATQERIGR